MKRTLVALLSAALLLSAGLPLLMMLAELLSSPDVALAALREPLALSAAKNTVLLSTGVTLLALSLGVPLGVLLARAEHMKDLRYRALVALPYAVPPYVSAIAWIALLNPSTGWLNAPLRALSLPAIDIYTLSGMIFVIGLESTPIVALAVADALDRIDASLEESARVCGASPLSVVARVTIPLASPAIAAAASVVFAGAAASYGVPYLLASGAPDPDFVLTTQIAIALDLDPASGRPKAVGLSSLLLVASVLLPALFSALLAGRRFTTVGGKSARPRPLALGRWRHAATLLLAAFLGASVLLPMGTLLCLSLLPDAGASLALGNLTNDHYVDLLGRASNREALLRSILLALAAAVVTVSVGALIALVERGSGRSYLSSAARAPYTVPGTVLALGLILAWSQEVRVIVLESVTLSLMLADTVWLLLLAYSVKLLALPVASISAALRSLDPALDEAARVSGASAPRAALRVALPILLPTMLSSGLLVFLPAFHEVTMSVLLSGPRTRTAGAVLFELQTYGAPTEAAALGVVVGAVAIAAQLLASRLQRQGAP